LVQIAEMLHAFASKERPSDAALVRVLVAMLQHLHLERSEKPLGSAERK
jgi:hypothetical protein